MPETANPDTATRNTADEEPAAHRDTPGIVRAALGAVALLTVLLTAFAWPTNDLEPRSLPLAIAAPSTEAAGAVETQLAEALGQDGVDVVEAADRDAAVTAIEDRKAYGAIVVDTDGAEILTATAASPLIAQLLGQVAAGMGAQPDSPPASVTDVAPAPDSDPNGATFSAAALPLAVGGLLVGAVTSLQLRRVGDRVTTAVLASAGAGLALAGVLQGWLGALSGTYWANASVIALAVLAVALPIIGLHRLLGRPGIGIMAALVVLLGNPQSGLTSAPEMLPLGWLGQLLPPGAAGTALRSTAFFDGTGIGTALVVLLCWAMAGLALTLLPRTKVTQPAGDAARSQQLATTIEQL